MFSIFLIELIDVNLEVCESLKQFANMVQGIKSIEGIIEVNTVRPFFV